MKMKIGVIFTFTMVFLLFFSFIQQKHSVESKVLEKKIMPIETQNKLAKNDINSMFSRQSNYKEGELIIKLKEKINESEKVKLKKQYSIKEYKNLKDDLIQIKVDPKANIKSIATSFIMNPLVDYIEPNYKVQLDFIPNDPYYKKQWYLSKINAHSAWNQTRGSKEVTVAIIDQGPQVTHPELKGKISKPIDIHTWSKTFPSADHGTHVAGIVGATMNHTGIAGIAPNVKIMPVNVLDKNGSGDIAALYYGIIYAVNNGADIINLSLGTYSYSYTLESAINYALNNGVVVIAAAGNDNTYFYQYPAAYSGVIGVSATDSSDHITDFSNYGSYIDFAAPGKSIYSTLKDSKYGYLDGTSMSTPVVTGTVALMLSKNPLLSNYQIYTILANSSKDLGYRGWDSLYGYGRVDVNQAIYQTPNPINNIAVTKDNFTFYGSNKLSISFSHDKNLSRSLIIKDSKGSIIRTLKSRDSSYASKTIAYWDGKRANGQYAQTGTYKIIASVTNGSESLYKTKTIKINDKVKPIIVPKNYTIKFSPSVTGKVNIPFSINKSSIVTVKITDKNGAIIRTLTSNKKYGKGTYNVTWDGRNSKGYRISDATYTIVYEIVDYGKLKGTTKKSAIIVDTKVNAKLYSNSSTLLKMNTSNKITTTILLSESTYMTLNVISDKGQVIKTIVNNELVKSGTIRKVWTGIKGNGSYADEGKYYFQYSLKDTYGNRKVFKTTMVTLQDWRTPKITAPSTINFIDKTNPIQINYSLSKTGKVTIDILKGSQVVRTIDRGTSKLAGSNKFIWDGKDNFGKIVSDGTFNYRINIMDKYNQKNSFTGIINVNFIKIKVEFPTIVSYTPYNDIASEVYYSLSTPALVTVEIYDNNNVKVRTLGTNLSKKSGINYFSWDGYDDRGWWVNPDSSPFTYIIKAKNTYRNTTTIKGKMSSEENPSWLTSAHYRFIPYLEDNYYNEKLDLQVITTTPATLDLDIYEYYFYSQPIERKEYSLQKGTNAITYIKPKSYIYSSLYYDIILMDKLGNKYYYYCDEYEMNDGEYKPLTRKNGSINQRFNLVNIH